MFRQILIRLDAVVSPLWNTAWQLFFSSEVPSWLLTPLSDSSGGLVRGEGTAHSGKQRLTVWDVAALRCPGPQWHQCTKLEISDMSGLPTLTAWLCFRAYHWLASPPCFARPWPFGVIPKSFGTFSWNRELPAHSPDRVMYCIVYIYIYIYTYIYIYVYMYIFMYIEKYTELLPIAK